MHDTSMYKELVFYLEACESGSMFENILPEGISVYATTASNSQEPSWGTYCGADAMVDGKDVGSCLGDLYAVSWMEDSDVVDTFAKETLDEQLAAVTTATNLSHVMGFGDTTMGSENIKDYQGLKQEGRGLRKPSHPLPKGAYEEHSRDSVVDSRDNQLHYLMHQYLKTGCPMVAEELKAEIDAREEADARFESIAAAVAGSEFEMMAVPSLSEFECHREAHEAVFAQCGGYTDYSLKYARSIVNLCEAGHSSETIVAAISAACY
jgi:legumain